MNKDDVEPTRTQSAAGSHGMIVLRSADVRRHLPIADCIDAMAEAFCALSDGRVEQPVRHVVPTRDGALYSMPAFVHDGRDSALAVKLVTLYPANHDRGLASHQGVIVLFDASNGSVSAMIEAGSLTAVRTAAVSALATRLLSEPDASELAVLGAGVQAESHIEAMLAVRPIERVRVWSRTAGHARTFAARASERHGIPVEAVGSPEFAIRGAAIICTVTGSPDPLTHSEWISPGTHINAVGASTPEAREIDSDTVSRATVVVDSREAALAESGDILIPLREGLTRPTDLVELGDIVTGRVRPGSGGTRLTLFKSLGLAVEDVVAARLVHQRAVSAGAAPIPFD